MPALSLILSTYEKPRELALALAAIDRVSLRGVDGLELLVADDGSGAATRQLVERFAAEASFDVRHVWHEDRGFRLAAIRNAAIRSARGDILVFVDGDSLVEPSALGLHAARCRPGVAHTGSRCWLDEAESERLLAGEWDLDAALRDAPRRDRRSRRVRAFKNALYRATGLKQRPKLLGGNCAVHRRDLESVNGFDEAFEGWGLEDDDLAARLRRCGVRVRDGTADCVVLHLYHPTHPSHRPTIHHTRNYRWFHRECVLTRCRRGLVRRGLDQIAFEVSGELPLALRELPQHLGQPRPGASAEVIVTTGEEGPDVRCAPTVRLPRGADVTACLEWLEQNV